MLTQVADLRDVHALIFKMGDGGSDLPAHLFLIAPKIDFRQISAPNFLADSQLDREPQFLVRFHKVVLTGVKEASRTDSSPSFGKKIRKNPSVMDGILCKKEVFYFKFMLVRSDILYHRGESNIFLVQPEIRKKIHWKEETVCDNDLMKKM